jgi:hypothetical protein
MASLQRYKRYFKLDTPPNSSKSGSVVFLWVHVSRCSVVELIEAVKRHFPHHPLLNESVIIRILCTYIYSYTFTFPCIGHIERISPCKPALPPFCSRPLMILINSFISNIYPRFHHDYIRRFRHPCLVFNIWRVGLACILFKKFKFGRKCQ